MVNDMIDFSHIPTIKRARQKLGELWFLLYNQCLCDPCLCHQRFKNAYLGDLWDSPSDALQDKVCMKAPFTRKIVQANTHKAILDIGSIVEERILNEYEAEKQAALEEHKKKLLERCQGSILELIKDAEAVERAACHREMQHLTEEFESQLADQLLGLQLKMEKEFEMSNIEHNRKMQEKLEAKVKAAVGQTTRDITKQLLEEIARQAKIVEKQFKAEFKMNDIKKQYESDKQVSEFRKTMHEARQRLECKNIANMLYILCMERRKCLEEKELIEDYYLTFKLKLLNRVSKQEEKIDKLKNELRHQIKQVGLRESCCREIIRQYQKFINFALRASPTQAQFLLSIQKLLNFELSKPKTKSNLCTPHRTCDTLFPWAHVEEEKQEVVPGLEITDHHDCFNELALPKRESNTELPAFTFKDKLYVRQDFRNLISQGIDLSPSHDLWSEDIELLVKTLRASISDIDVNRDGAIIDEKKSDEPESVVNALIRPSSMRQIKSDVEKSENGVTKESSYDEQGAMNFIEQEKSTLKPDTSQLSLAQIIDEPCLLAARNSIEITLQKGSVRSLRSKHVDINEDEEIHYAASSTIHKVVSSRPEVRTSVEIPSDAVLTPKQQRSSFSAPPVEQHSVVFQMEPSSMEPSPMVPWSPIEVEEEEVKKIPSKILSARDSVAYLRISRQALLEPSPMSNIRTARRRPPASASVLVKEICCEKCPKRHSLQPEEDELNEKKTSSGDLQKLLKSHEDMLARVFPQGISNTNLADFYPDKLAKLYKQPKPKGKKKKSDAHKTKKVTKSIKIIEEDEMSMDRIPVNNDATIGKMKSFISELSDNPDLIKLFTACQR